MKASIRIPRSCPASLVVLAIAAGAARAGDEDGTRAAYRRPSADMVAIAEAPPTPDVRLSPDRAWLLILERPALKSIADLSRPERRLAGLRIDPRTNGPSRAGHATRLLVRSMAEPTAAERAIAGLPEDARIAGPAFSPDGKHVAFALAREDRTEIWVADLAKAAARRLTDARVNAAFGPAFFWLPDSSGLAVKLVPADRGPEPAAPAAPDGPIVTENLGRKMPARTYQDLLETPHDAALFAHLLAAQAAVVPLADGAASRPLGPVGLIVRVEPSPDGRFFLFETVERPFSYQVPVDRFPSRISILDREGREVRRLADLPLALEVPTTFGAVRPGPRAHDWRADAPATVVWVEARDGGDPAVEAPVRDEVLLLAAPFEGEPAVLASLAHRFSGIAWGKDDLALVTESWRKTRRTRTWVVAPGKPAAPPKLLFDRSSEDRYADPGTPLERPTPQGTRVLHLVGATSLLLIGEGASPEGNRPFLDRIDLASVEKPQTTRLFRSEAPYYERPMQVLDDAGTRVLTRRESATEPPNYFVRVLGGGGTSAALTSFRHPYPKLANVKKELIKYARKDGVPLSATLYLPPGYDPERDGPLPVLMWAYPVEFKSAGAAGQVTDSPHRFSRVGSGSPLFFLTEGYAVLDDPKMPIVGEGESEPNDSYVEQLVASAEAAVEEVCRRGVGDRDRIAIGGHSYGAFMTANLLAHSDLFRAGIARSGAYNRTLTAFGFQGEDRSLWKAPDVYFRMSPFVHADRVNEPILLIHGAEDDNAGTFPMQSERFYAALAGLGATARLVMLPHESHGYQARESVLHMLWEMADWLDRHVKRAPPRR